MECAPLTGEFPSQVEGGTVSRFKFQNSSFKLQGWNVADRRMEPLSVINILEKKGKSLDQIVIGFVVLEMNLLVF